MRFFKELSYLSNPRWPVRAFKTEPLTRHPTIGEVTVQFGFERWISRLPTPPHLQRERRGCLQLLKSFGDINRLADLDRSWLLSAADGVEEESP
ncbi:hypothetical protein O1Q96_00420 (plasmid) [Streptomyces sp. Qhu-G9]|nr:hypothetical protein [Streptomyces aurantiacus]WAU78348.1 hypothetical protein O1Q96_00420 [Streptomyces aurantiacus]